MEYVKLGDIASYINGYAFKPIDWKNKGIPIIRIQNLNNHNQEFNYFDGEIDEKYFVKRGDILISWSASIGVFEWEKENALLNQHIFKVKFDKMEINKTYFKFMVSKALEKSTQYMHGSTMKHITKGYFDAISMPVVDLNKQEKVAIVLEKVQHFIDKRKEQIEACDELIKSLFYHMFGDPISNSSNWTVYILNDITTSRLGKMLDEKKQTGDSKYPYLANFNVQWFKFQFNTLNEMDFDEKDKKQFELKSGDVLVTEGGEVGRCAIWKEQIEKCYFQKALHRIRCNTQIILPEYLVRVFYFRSQYNQFDDVIGSKSTIAHLTGEKLKMLEVPVPPIDLQNEFAQKVEKIEHQKQLLQQSLTELETNFNALMQRAFKGELF